HRRDRALLRVPPDRTGRGGVERAVRAERTLIDCPRCHVALAADALVCGSCRGLVHAELLGALARRADVEEAAGGLTATPTTLREMLARRPPGTRQADQILARVTAVSDRLDQPQAPASRTHAGQPASSAGGGRGIAAVVTTALAVSWKGKFLLLAGLSKAKFL